jgi:hypothetical protein
VFPIGVGAISVCEKGVRRMRKNPRNAAIQGANPGDLLRRN